MNGALYFLRSFSWIFHPSVKRYVYLSFLISAGLFCVMVWGMLQVSSWFAAMLTSWIPWEWSGESYLYSWMINILSFVILIGIFKYIVLAVLAPFMSLISEKIEAEITPGNKGRKSAGLISGMLRGIRVNIVNVAKELFYTLLLLLLCLIPGLALVTAPMIFVVQAYFSGFGLMDFYLERYTDYTSARQIVLREKWFAVSIGAIFIFLFAVPLIGMILAPVTGTIAATLYFEKEGKSPRDLV